MDCGGHGATCPTLQLQVKSSRRSLKPGLSVVLTAKATNMGAAAVNRVSVRLDLPPALVPYTDPKSTKGPLIVNGAGGSAVSWVDLPLNAGHSLLLKVRARTCATAAPGAYTLGGTVYSVNATGAATCIRSAAWAYEVRRRAPAPPPKYGHTNSTTLPMPHASYLPHTYKYLHSFQ